MRLFCFLISEKCSVCYHAYISISCNDSNVKSTVQSYQEAYVECSLFLSLKGSKMRDAEINCITFYCANNPITLTSKNVPVLFRYNLDQVNRDVYFFNLQQYHFTL